jgi:hypothetical protein
MRGNITNFPKMIFVYFFGLGRPGPKKAGLKSTQSEIGPGPAQKRTLLWLESTQPRGLG